MKRGTLFVSEPGNVEDAALLDGEFGDWNFGGGPLLEVGYMGGIYAEHRAASLVRFDLSRWACDRVISAKLRLYKPRCFVQTTPVEVHVHAVAPANADWAAGASAAAADARASSWRRRKDGRPWAGAEGCARPGVDYEAHPLDVQTARADRGEWMEFRLPVALVQRWRDRTHSNAGLLLRAGGEGRDWGEHVFFHASEHYLGRGPQLVVEATPGPARLASAQPKQPAPRYVLPPADGALDRWLRANKRLAKFTKDARMDREQARVFYFFDTHVRQELIVGRYQKPLEATFVRMEPLVARGDKEGVRRKLREVRNTLLVWEYIRETSWYTAGPMAEVLSPLQLGILFARSIFGRMEEKADKVGKGRLLRKGADPNTWEGIWQPVPAEKMPKAIRATMRLLREKLELTPEQSNAMGPSIARFERLESEHVGRFRRSLDRTRALIARGADDAEMFQTAKEMHRDHERFLYYQSIYNTPRWELFLENAPVLPFARWLMEVRKQSYKQASDKEKRESIQAYEEHLGEQP